MICIICKNVFDPKTYNQIVCTDISCRKKYQCIKTTEIRKRKYIVKQLKCKYCNTIFNVQKNSKKINVCYNIDCIDKYHADRNRLHEVTYKEHRKFLRRERYKKNPLLGIKYRAERRSLEFGAGKLPKIDILEERLYLFGKNICCYCNKETKLELEHLTALSKGGLNNKENLFGACKHCNNSKLAKDWKLWFRQQQFYTQQRESEIIQYSDSVKLYREGE